MNHNGKHDESVRRQGDALEGLTAATEPDETACAALPPIHDKAIGDPMQLKMGGQEGHSLHGLDVDLAQRRAVRAPVLFIRASIPIEIGDLRGDGDRGEPLGGDDLQIAPNRRSLPGFAVELVGGVGAGMMTISGNGGAGDYTWSGTSLKLEGGLIYGSMGGTKGIGVGGIISYHLGLGGDLSGDGGDAYKTGENPFEDGSPYFDLLQFSLAVSYGF